MDELEAIRYPIGRFAYDPELTASKRVQLIERIAALPADLRGAVDGLSDVQLDQRYRPEGWTCRQVVHHLADEHMNAFAYFKMAVTEDEPTVKTYDEPRWAETRDGCEAPVELSLSLLSALHARWVIMLNALDQQDFARAYIHRRGRTTIDDGIQLYAWHGSHHVSQISRLRDRQGW
ncbi:MAG: YfiT family bacillithiol transferase [Gemmatimonadaceae bacterium]